MQQYKIYYSGEESSDEDKRYGFHCGMIATESFASITQLSSRRGEYIYLPINSPLMKHFEIGRQFYIIGRKDKIFTFRTLARGTMEGFSSEQIEQMIGIDEFCEATTRAQDYPGGSDLMILVRIEIVNN